MKKKSWKHWIEISTFFKKSISGYRNSGASSPTWSEKQKTGNPGWKNSAPGWNEKKNNKNPGWKNSIAPGWNETEKGKKLLGIFFDYASYKAWPCVLKYINYLRVYINHNVTS